MDHHYLSEFYLKRFASKGYFYIYDKIEKTWETKKKNEAKKCFCIPWLYGWQDENESIENTCVEDFWGKIESRVPPLYKNLKRWKVTKKSPNDSEFEIFLPFISLMTVKAPHYLNRVRKEINKKIKEQMVIIPTATQEARNAMFDWVDEIKGVSAKPDFFRNKFLQELIYHYQSYLYIYNHFDWTFYHTDQTKFITSDWPVTLISSDTSRLNHNVPPPKDPISPGTVWTDPNTKIFFSLRRDIAVEGRPGTGKIIGLRLAEKQHVERINVMIYGSAPRYIISSQEIKDMTKWENFRESLGIEGIQTP